MKEITVIKKMVWYFNYDVSSKSNQHEFSPN